MKPIPKTSNGSGIIRRLRKELEMPLEATDYSASFAMPAETNSSYKDAWQNDGTRHHDVSPQALYRNSWVDTFLNSDRHTVLISSKGMGKTLLLRAKKRILEQSALGHQIIPRHAEYDEPRVHGDLPKTGYEDLSFWNSLWQAAIIFSILTHLGNDESALIRSDGNLDSYIEQFDITDEFKTKLKFDIRRGSQNLPSYYLGQLLRYSLGVAKRFARTIHIVPQLSFNYINSSFCVFIDGFDQTLESHFQDNLEAWKNAQLGLLKAIHQLNTQNPHIKVFASIRQEAFAGFLDPDKEVIRGKSIMLTYSYDDLEKMFLHAIKRYTPHNSFLDFFGTETLQNKDYSVTELPFATYTVTQRPHPAL